VSRAGATILTGLVVGLDRRAATEFSFFLALPTMYAACLFALWKSRHDLDTARRSRWRSASRPPSRARWS